MKKIIFRLLIIFNLTQASGQNNDIPLFLNCATEDNQLACSYFTIHNLLLEKLNGLKKTELDLKKAETFVVSTLLRFDENGKIDTKGSVIHSTIAKDYLVLDDVLNSISHISPKLDDNAKPKSSYFRNTFYFKFNTDTFETWNNIKAKKEDFNMPEKVPVYEGCKSKWSNKKLKKCMSLKIAQHVQSAFNTKEAAKNTGLLNGTEIRILAFFKIDSTGKIKDIRVKCPIKSIEKETVKVIKDLPNIKPGKIAGKPVLVPYTLPIRFIVSF